MPEQLEATLDGVSGIFVARAAPLGPPSDAQLDLIRKHVVDPTMMDEREMFTWQATVSNGNLDSYYTRMHESSLRNFVEDALAGLAYMNSHRTGGYSKDAELPLGHSFDARYVGPSGPGPARVDETFYTFRGMAPNGTGSLTTDQLIENLRSGIARDISITFMPGDYRCSIDGQSWMSSRECRHWPGVTYPKLDSKGNDTGQTELAYLWVHDAHQSEASSVFDGATPGCMVTKAKRMAEAGEIRADVIDLLEQRYRINLPHPARSFGGADMANDPPTERKGDTMPTGTEPNDGGQTPDLLAQLRSVLTEHGVTAAETAEAALASVRTVMDEVKRLRPLADEGRIYRADLVKDALVEGKRAMGDAFAEETYRGVLDGAPIETVKRMRDDWKATADKQLPGGRATQDADPTPIEGARRRRVPAAARG